MLNTNLDLAPKLRMDGAIILLPIYAFIATTGTNSPVQFVGATKPGTLRNKADNLQSNLLYYCCLCILRRGYPDWGFSLLFPRL